MKTSCKRLSGLFFFGLLLALTIVTANAQKKINFSSLDKENPHDVSGTLYLPSNVSGPCPAIVVIHGTSGIDARGTFYRQAILDAGIGFFEVDFKTGIFKGPRDRPEMSTFLPMAFAALKELRKIPEIDPTRIGIMGFSLGGGVALRADIESLRKLWMGSEKGFATFAAFYPVCKAFTPVLEKSNSTLTGAPMIIFYGTNDVYGDGEEVPRTKALLAEKYNFELKTVEYPGAAHAFNLDAPPQSYFDPGAKHFKGHTEWNADAANDSRIKVVAFLKETLGVK